MVFEQPDGLGIALYIERETLLSSGATELAKEEVCRLARCELARAGYGEQRFSRLEAFENPEGWLVFAAAEGKRQSAYYRFHHSDQYLDAFNALALPVEALWTAQDGSVTAKLNGTAESLQRLSYRLSEYACELEGSELFFRHLNEQHQK